MPSGVYIRTEEQKRKNRESQREAQNRAEVRKQKSKSQKKFWELPGSREKIIKAMKEAWENLELREEQSKAMKEAWEDPILRKMWKEAMKEGWNNIEVRKRQSEVMKEIMNRIDIRDKCSKAHSSPEVKKRRSKITEEVWKNKSDEEKNEWLSKIFKSNKRKPNGSELLVSKIIEYLRPTEFKYIGDGQIWIAGKCPDWININGKKQVIEYFSNYWHGEEHRRVRKDFSSNKEHEQDRIKHFKKYGFECLVIWEHELKDKDKLTEKIKNF